MLPRFSLRDDQDILTFCAKYIARDSTDPRHNFGQYAPQDFRARLCAAWRWR